MKSSFIQLHADECLITERFKGLKNPKCVCQRFNLNFLFVWDELQNMSF